MGKPRPPLILAYHGVADVRFRDDPEGLFVAPDTLRHQIGRLRRWGYQLLAFGEVARRIAAGRGTGCASLTFDDGLADNLEPLGCILREQAATATVFVTTGWMGRAHPSVPYARCLTPEEVVEMHAAGVEVGSHTMTHPNLTRLDERAAYDEIRGAREELEELLRAPVPTFAYPFGFATAATIAAARRAGVEAACRVAGAGSFDEPLNLPRQDTNGKNPVGFWLKRDDRYEPLMRHTPAKALRRLGRETRRLTS